MLVVGPMLSADVNPSQSGPSSWYRCVPVQTQTRFPTALP